MQTNQLQMNLDWENVRYTLCIIRKQLEIIARQVRSPKFQASFQSFTNDLPVETPMINWLKLDC